MGEGFVVMQSNDVDIYYYQDEPGELLHTDAGKTKIEKSDTVFGAAFILLGELKWLLRPRRSGSCGAGECRGGRDLER